MEYPALWKMSQHIVAGGLDRLCQGIKKQWQRIRTSGKQSELHKDAKTLLWEWHFRDYNLYFQTHGIILCEVTEFNAIKVSRQSKTVMDIYIFIKWKRMQIWKLLLTHSLLPKIVGLHCSFTGLQKESAKTKAELSSYVPLWHH